MSADLTSPAGGRPPAVTANPTPLVLLGHGTRSEPGRRVVEDLAAQVTDRLPDLPVRLGYLDVIEPTAAQVLDGLDEAVVVPLLMTAGYHIDVDLPQVIGDRTGIIVTPVFTEAADLAAIAAQRLAQTEAGSGTTHDPVVLLGAGSSVDKACRQVERVAARLAEGTGRTVRHGFLSAAEPAAEEVVRDVLAERPAGGVTVIPLLLAPGYFLSLAVKLADLDPSRVRIAEPLGADPLLVDSVLTGYASHGETTAG